MHYVDSGPKISRAMTIISNFFGDLKWKTREIEELCKAEYKEEQYYSMHA